MRPTVRPAASSISSAGASPPPAGRSPTCTLATTSGSSTSQVKPVDAFGAILRGRQVVVVGDSRQLPPTDFFAVISEGEEEESGDSVGDMESILSLLLGRGAPERMLRWHYRSRHESLIAVSNHEFYGDRLVIFPSPGTHAEARGLRLRHLPDTAYEPGTSRTNPAEAKAVAEAVMRHAGETPDLSLGVVAFRVAQRDALEDLLARGEVVWRETRVTLPPS